MRVARNYTLTFFSARGRSYLRIQSREYVLAPLETLPHLTPISFVPRGDIPFFPPLGGDSPNFSQARRRCGRREVYLYTGRSRSRNFWSTDATRGNTEYHRQTLISFCRGQIVPSRSNFRGSSRALDRASTRETLHRSCSRGIKYNRIIFILLQFDFISAA